VVANEMDSRPRVPYVSWVAVSLVAAVVDRVIMVMVTNEMDSRPGVHYLSTLGSCLIGGCGGGSGHYGYGHQQDGFKARGS
jgi:hypothetical protein